MRMVPWSAVRPNLRDAEAVAEPLHMFHFADVPYCARGRLPTFRPDRAPSPGVSLVLSRLIVRSGPLAVRRVPLSSRLARALPAVALAALAACADDPTRA